MRQSKLPIMRIAHAKITGTREGCCRVKALLDDPDLVHAIDPVGTWDGDPWRGSEAPCEVHFYGGGRNSGPRAACGRGPMRAVLGDKFVPTDEPLKARQCPDCARVVTEGKGFRNPPREYLSPFCEDFIRVRIDGSVVVKNCTLRDFHPGPHRARDKSEWTMGVDDYVPSADELGCQITQAS